MNSIKRIFLTTGVLMLFSFGILAQEFNAGVYGGGVASQLDGDYYGGYNKAGAVAGAFVNRYINKNLAWQMGLRYCLKGSRRVDNKAGVYYKSQLHYVEIPLTIRYQYFKKVDFEGGISLGYLAKAMEDLDGYGLLPANPEFRKIEAAAVGGLNYHFNDKIIISAQYSYSIFPVRPYSSGYERFMDKGQYNNIILFFVTYNLSNWR